MAAMWLEVLCLSASTGADATVSDIRRREFPKIE